MAGISEGSKVLRQLFKELERSGAKKMYRREPLDPTRAFDREEQYKLGMSMKPEGEPGGVYRANHPFDIPGLVSGSGTPRDIVKKDYKEMNVGRPKNLVPFDSIAVPMRNSRQKTFSVEEWEQYKDIPHEDLTNLLKKKYDFVDFPDVAAGHPEMRQTVQLNPLRSVVRFSKTDYGIVGAGGAGALGLLAGDALSPNDADAAGLGIGKQIKGVFKLFQTAMRSKTSVGDEMRKAGQLKPAKSSASDRLQGMPYKGSKISGVYQGAEDRRYIHLEDGRIFPANAATIHDLAAARGTTQYISKFDAASGEAVPGGGAKWDQILKSLNMNEQRGVPPRAGGSKPTRMAIIENSLQFRNEALDPEEVADQILVRSNRTKMWFLWPRKYAEPAEAAGLVTIDRAKNTLSTNKGLYNGSTKKR